MPEQTIKLLHVEDSVADRMMVAKFLGSLKEYTFTIVRAATEMTASSELGKGGTELVILDYKLPMGDGVSCLKKLRKIDPLVPIIVLSGVTTPEIGAQVAEAGADDYLSKQDLSQQSLGQSVLRVLARSHVRIRLRDFCKDFTSTVGPELRRELDDVLAAGKRGNLTREELLSLFEAISQHIDIPDPQRVLRPILLDLLQGMTGELLPNENAKA